MDIKAGLNASDCTGVPNKVATECIDSDSTLKGVIPHIKTFTFNTSSNFFWSGMSVSLLRLNFLVMDYYNKNSDLNRKSVHIFKNALLQVLWQSEFVDSCMLKLLLPGFVSSVQDYLLIT